MSESKNEVESPRGFALMSTAEMEWYNRKVDDEFYADVAVRSILQYCGKGASDYEIDDSFDWNITKDRILAIAVYGDEAYVDDQGVEVEEEPPRLFEVDLNDPPAWLVVVAASISIVDLRDQLTISELERVASPGRPGWDLEDDLSLGKPQKP